jgi:hypothetical protein
MSAIVFQRYSGYAPAYFASLREAMAQHRDEAFDAFRGTRTSTSSFGPIVDAPFIRWLERRRRALTNYNGHDHRRGACIAAPHRWTVPLPLPLGSPECPQF